MYRVGELLYPGTRIYNIYVQGRRATVPWYMKWSGDMNQKTKIYIGGIFPNTGTKYVAPELAPGKIRYFKN